MMCNTIFCSKTDVNEIKKTVIKQCYTAAKHLKELKTPYKFDFTEGSKKAFYDHHKITIEKWTHQTIRNIIEFGTTEKEKKHKRRTLGITRNNDI